jgi:hypothetical protein
LPEELSDALIIAGDRGLYFSNFKPCIMPGQEPDAESEHKDEQADCDAIATRQRILESAVRAVYSHGVIAFHFGGLIFPA